MSYLSSLPEKYRHWKGWKQSKRLSYIGFLPSCTSAKYPLHSTFQGKKVLNIGCGGSTYKAPNVTNTDLYPGKGVDIVLDLSVTPLPFKDNEFDYIIANHVLEHVPNWFNCFEELCRIVKVGGWIEVWVPPISSDGAFTYRDHINYIGLESFDGTQGLLRPGTNSHAANSNTSKTQNVEMMQIARKPTVKWWSWFAPNCVLNWMALHLRNVISEEGFFFLKRGE